jgi:uncharacterized protein YfaP (DUF2135 family)
LNLSGANTSGITATATKVGLPLQVVELQEAKVRETYERDLVLVRPDGHVAWRGESIPANAAAIVDRVRGAG